MNEKNNEPGFQILLVTLRESIEFNVLRMMWREHCIQAVSVEDITKELIKTCIENRSKRSIKQINDKEID